MLLQEAREEIVNIGLQLLNAGYVHNGQGNISYYDRKENYIAITPSAVPYQERSAKDICVVDIDGNMIEGCWKQTTEHALHMIYYRNRDDVNAVVHTHTPYATVFGIIGKKSMPLVLNEAAIGLGGPLPIAPYARPGTEKLAEVTWQATGQGTGAIMAHHGLVTVGGTLEQAYFSTQAAETTALTIILARSMGEEVNSLPLEEAEELRSSFLSNYSPKRISVDPS